MLGKNMLTFLNNRLKDIFLKLRFFKHKIISLQALSGRQYNVTTSHLCSTSTHLNLTIL